MAVSLHPRSVDTCLHCVDTLVSATASVLACRSLRAASLNLSFVRLTDPAGKATCPGPLGMDWVDWHQSRALGKTFVFESWYYYFFTVIVPLCHACLRILQITNAEYADVCVVLCCAVLCWWGRYAWAMLRMAALHEEFSTTFGNKTLASIYRTRAATVKNALQSKYWHGDHWATNELSILR
eukprot:SAG31_NODE_360_length_17025_cov_5.362460_8_plen_182_part_00